MKILHRIKGKWISLETGTRLLVSLCVLAFYLSFLGPALTSADNILAVLVSFIIGFTVGWVTVRSLFDYLISLAD